MTISSQGNYDSIVCGTGFLHDLDGNGTTISGGTVSIGGMGYEIAFTAGVGVMKIGPNGTPSVVGLAQDGWNVIADALPPVPPGTPVMVEWFNHTADVTHGNLAGEYVGSGVVEITPMGPPGNNCVVDDDGRINQFRAAGAFVIASASVPTD